MLKTHGNTITWIFLAVLIAGCGSSATATPVPPTTVAVSSTATFVPPTNEPSPTEAPATEPSPTATPAPEPTVTAPAATADQVINAETVARLEEIVAFDLPDSFVNTIVFSPDSRSLITGDRNGEVLVWERETWEKTPYLPARSNRAADSAAQVWFWGTLALSPDGNVIVTAYGDDGAVTGRDRAGQELFAFSYGARVYSVAISPDGQFLAVGGLQSNVIIFDLETRHPVADLTSDYEYIMNLVFSPAGKTLLVSYERPGNSLSIWDTATWQETATFPHVTERTDYHDVLFSPDGEELVIATIEDVEITFLDIATGQIVKEFPEHSRAPYQMAFSPDGSLLASASDDGTLRLWDMETGVNVKTIRTNREAGAVAFSPDGTLIAVSVWGAGVQVWGVTSTATPVPEPTATTDTWFKTYGETQNDVCNDVLLADDGGFFIVGVTDLEFEPEQQGDIYLIRTDAAGDILWEKTYGGEGYEAGATAFQTSDGGLMISGATNSLGAGGIDIYLLKVDENGNELWSKTFGGPLDEVGAAWPMDDGGYILGGNIVDPNDPVVDNPGVAGYAGFAGRSNVYLARTDSDGNELWSRTFGGEDNVLASSGLQTPDGGFVILATIMYFPDNDDDIYLLKVDENGNEVWSRTWERGMSSGYGLVQTADGGYLVTGPYSSPDDMDRSIRDFMFVKFDAQGNEVWMSSFGDPDIIDYGQVLAATSDGGYVAAGWAVRDLITWDEDIVIVKVDGSGQLMWEKIIETDAHSMFGTILQHPDGGYVVAGSIFNGRNFDIFVIKTDSQGNVSE